MDTNQVEVIYFPKPCPYCKQPLFRVEKMSASWLECRNEECAYLASYPNDDQPYATSFNRR